MLVPDFLQNVAERAVELWEQLNIYAIRDIARRIKDAENHMTATAEWQEYKLRQGGLCRDEIMKEVRRLLPASDEEVRRIFEEAIITSNDNDADVFRAAGVEPQPFNTRAAQDTMQAIMEQTNGTLRNLTGTTAGEGQKAYFDACDRAVMKVRSGVVSQSQAIREAIVEAAEGGLRVYYPKTGWTDTVEVAVRRAITTGANQVALRATIDNCERMGTNYVIVSSHLGARVSDTNPIANHYGWQGQVYRIAKRERGFWGRLSAFFDMLQGKREYPLLREATGYPDDPLGLGGYNCRHSMYPYIPNVSKNHMEQYDSEENRKRYELSQKQRAKERDIRKDRRIKAGLEAAGEDAVEVAKRLRRKINDYNAFCRENRLTPQMDRTFIA